MDIGKDLQRAYDDGYEQGKQDADRIRSMTDEELAEVIADGFCSTRPDKCNNFKRCIDCTLDWLKEEVKNNG